MTNSLNSYYQIRCSSPTHYLRITPLGVSRDTVATSTSVCRTCSKTSLTTASNEKPLGSGILSSINKEVNSLMTPAMLRLGRAGINRHTIIKTSSREKSLPSTRISRRRRRHLDSSRAHRLRSTHRVSPSPRSGHLPSNIPSQGRPSSSTDSSSSLAITSGVLSRGLVRGHSR